VRLARAYYDIVLDMRPSCPLCVFRTIRRRGIDDEEIFWCPTHGAWVPVAAVDAEGVELPIFRWEPYSWRTT